MNSHRALAAAADGVVQAVCLVAVVALPLYFTVLTGTGYEADKALLVRFLAGVGLAAWVVGLAADPDWTRVPRRALPIIAAAVALLLTYCVGTIFSIDQRLSLWGSQGRQEGLWTHAAYLVVFLLVVTRFQQRARLERLVAAMLFASIPVVLYGLSQQLGYDPIPSTGDPNTLQWPVRSSLGQHIFLGSYLVLVLPFTVANALWLTRVRRPEQASVPPWEAAAMAGACLVLGVASYFALVVVGVDHTPLYTLLPAVLGGITALAVVWQRALSALPRIGARFYGVLAILQALCLAATGARGAWLAALASAPAFGFLFAWRRRRADLWRLILAGTALAGVFLVVLNISGGPLQPLRTVKGINRVANITDSGGAGGSGQGRLLIWQGVGQLLTTTPDIGGAWGGPLRDVVGYGPETMHWAFEPVFPLKLRVVTSEIWTWDRAHDIYLDQIIDTGILGLLALVTLIVVSVRKMVVELPRVDERQSWLLIAAGASLAGHLVDGVFGLETPVTYLLIWVIVALIAVAGDVPAKDSAVETVREPGFDLAGYWGAGLAAGVALVSVPGLAGDPVTLAAVWTASLLAGIGLTLLQLEPTLWPPALTNLRRHTVPLAASLLLFILVSGSQTRFQAAAIAERLGLGQLSLGQPAQAVSFLQTANQDNGFEPQYETELAGAYLSLASSKPATGDPVTYFPGVTSLTVDKRTVQALGRTQLLGLSEQSLSSAESLSPLDPDVYNNLGNLYAQWGRFDQALQEYTQAEQLSPDNPRYLDQDALAELEAGRAAAAKAEAQRALQLDSTFWLSHYALALGEGQTGSIGKAKQEAELALYWMKNYWPTPPSSQVRQLQAIAQQG